MRSIPRLATALISAIIPGIVTAAIIAALTDAEFGGALTSLCALPWAIGFWLVAGDIRDDGHQDEADEADAVDGHACTPGSRRCAIRCPHEQGCMRAHIVA